MSQLVNMKHSKPKRFSTPSDPPPPGLLGILLHWHPPRVLLLLLYLLINKIKEELFIVLPVVDRDQVYTPHRLLNQE